MLVRSARGEDDLHEFLRRLTVNELLGNPDAHLKNFGFLHRTPRHAELSPAYDILAYSAWLRFSGHDFRLAHVKGLGLMLREGGVHTISLKNWSLHKIRGGSRPGDASLPHRRNGQ